MNSIAVPLPSSERDRQDQLADRGFRWLVTAAGVFVLVSDRKSVV